LEKANYWLEGTEYKLCLNDFEDMCRIIEEYEMEKNTKVNSIFKVSLIKYKLFYVEMDGKHDVEINPSGQAGM